MTRPFIHRHAGHCESGTVSALLRDRGLDLSEPMIFGIGCGIFFIYMPYIKLGGIPLIAYRSSPGGIIKMACKRLGVKIKKMRFGSPDKARDELDRLLKSGASVGLRTSGFWLPYFPRDMRFQFNAHHLVVFDKEGADYHISDPVFEYPVVCPEEDLQRARFAKGLFAPKGFLFYPEHIPAKPDIKSAVVEGIRFTCRRMIGLPFVPFIGVSGIRFLARRMKTWPERFGRDKAVTFVGSVVRMQEEIGTGGAGFRFMYTAFLQEACEILKNGAVLGAAKQMSETGDMWRAFAVLGAQVCKGHETNPNVFDELSKRLSACADREEKIFRLLKDAV